MRCTVLILSAAFLCGCAHQEEPLVRRVRHADGGAAKKAAEGTLVPVTLNERVFAVRPREAALDKFPCQRCHKVPLAQMKHDGKDGKPRAHWNVKLKHAEESVMACATCHEPGGDLNSLRTVAGRPVAINEGWKVCAQCHSRQADDWAGGAHGKRAVGWDSARVVKSCTECHNPHTPQWDKRQPVHVALTGLAAPGKGN